MTQSDHKQKGREITYQVGWKKGRIQVQDSKAPPKDGRAQTPAAASPSSVQQEQVKEVTPSSIGGPALTGAAPGNKLLAYIWKEAPAPSLKGSLLLLALLPIPLMGALFWLLLKLTVG